MYFELDVKFGTKPTQKFCCFILIFFEISCTCLLNLKRFAIQITARIPEEIIEREDILVIPFHNPSTMFKLNEKLFMPMEEFEKLFEDQKDLRGKF
jgi:hypothetical protein